MGRLAFILRQKLSAVIFIVIALAGGILIFWYINGKEDNHVDKEKSPEILENIVEGGDPEPYFEDYNAFSSLIPHGLRAVSLPVSYFGNTSAIMEGDSVDIISVFYDTESNNLISEVVLSEKEVIVIEKEIDQDIGNSGYFSDGNIENLSLGNDSSRQLKKILVITFYLKVIEVKKAFIAIESGQLYVSLCPS